MNKSTADTLTVAALALGAFGALSLVGVAQASAPHSATKAHHEITVAAPVVTANCDRLDLASRLVRYLGLADTVTVTVKDLPDGVGAWSLGGRIEIDQTTDCAKLPRFVAHELGHELDRSDPVKGRTARENERVAECIADRAVVRIYAMDKAPVICTPAETARAAKLAPKWSIR